ncbi:TNF receptor-associated factor 2 [Pelobates cultripes]|uniref:TNF receptor-associated factor n=1 Tax=Pelobates cultripes TaxID=61616 RepID=A0AAD1T1W2_PELCU|nr:TNF receptor-associated factor 2 [Pelobates cultripes]
MNDYGYPKVICNDVPERKYLCCHCENILRKAVQTMCGHRYCAQCLSRLASSTNRTICPKCREGEDPSSLSEECVLIEEKSFSDVAINKEISELKVHCATSECTWAGVLKDYDDHRNLCDYTEIQCHTGCGQMVRRKHLADHLENECPNNKTNLCPKCSQRIRPNELPRHVCPKRGSEDQKKGKNGPGSGKEKCVFSQVGCSFRGIKEKLKEHEKSSSSAHLALLLSVVAEQGSKKKKDTSHQQSDELEQRIQVTENILTVLNREMENMHAQLASEREQNVVRQRRMRAMEHKIDSYHHALAMKDVQINELSLRLQALEQATYDGVFVWRITNLTQRCQDAINGQSTSLYSPAFYSAKYGYKACLRIYLNGDGAGRGTHVSLFFAVMKGEYDAFLFWPFKHKVTFMLLDQSNREHILDAFRPDYTSASFQRPIADMNIASGCPLFCPLAKLHSPTYNYVKEDTMFIRCIIESNP